MLDHVSINCADLPAAAAFYDAVLAPLGYSRLMDFGDAVGYGADRPSFWLATQGEGGPSSRPNREVHVAFSAADAAAVRAFFEAAQRVGAEVLHEPALHAEYHEGYYAAFIRDPDGNNVEAVTHTGA